jgi:hypothetical protein
MSMIEGLSRIASRIQERRMRRRTEALIASLPHDIQRDIGWPAAARLYSAGRTRFLL